LTPFLFLAAAASASAPPETIVVTASREPVEAQDAPASVTVFEDEEIDRLALPATSDLLRLVPGVSVASTGPRGTQTQLRIRGAEANHTLLFVDGIRFNDPAAGNEARFELLTSDALSRIEVVRGPQSALWGSEALGGVVSLSTADPLRARGISALAEYGSHDSARASAQFATRTGNLGLSGSAGWLSSDGIDSFGGGGERDGFENRNASLKAVYQPRDGLELGAVGHWVEGESDYDGFDPVTFQRGDTLDNTENRIRAVRGWGAWTSGGWAASADIGFLDSANRNRLGDTPVNRTFGERFSAGAQLSRTFGVHRLTAAIEHEAEDFRARDEQYGGATDQDRGRNLMGFVGEWRAEWSPLVSTDVAVRRDSFSAYSDATTFRAAVQVSPLPALRLHAGYGEGIAQPSFYDLYGFFPGSFLGNPALRPERSKGWEAGVRWSQGPFSAGITGFTQRLRDEIVDTFDTSTFLSSTENVTGTSRRKGIEVEAEYRASDALALTANYTLLDADEQKVASGALVREVRRPRHSANLAATGAIGRFSWGASAAWVGSRSDVDFDLFPAKTVRLDDYLLASLRVGWALTDQIEAYARVENAFSADYQDVVGYNTPGRTVYAGVRLRL
jgi:vitamin B12 transporter